MEVVEEVVVEVAVAARHLVREALDVDRVREQVAEGEHVRQRRPRAVELVRDLAERRAAGLVLALAASFVAKAPDHDRRVVAVALHQRAHIRHVLRLVGEEACVEVEARGERDACAFRGSRVT